MRSPEKNRENALPDPTLGWSEAVKQASLAQLARMLESPQFRTSKRCSLLLRYVVEQASEYYLEPGREDENRSRPPAGSYLPEVQPTAQPKAEETHRSAFRLKRYGIAAI